MTGVAIRCAFFRAFFFLGVRKPDDPSAVRKERRQLAFRQRPIQQSKFYRNIVKPARCEAAVEMPQPRHDHPDDRDLDVGPRLIEDQEIEARAPGDVDAGVDLRARVVEGTKRRA